MARKKKSSKKVENLPFPKALRDDKAFVEMGNKRVPDPYRPFEKFKDPAVLAWVNEHNERTGTFLDKATDAKRLATLLEEAFNFPRQSPAYKYGDYHFWTRNDGLQPQDVHYYKKGENGETKVLFDPMSVSPEGRVFVQSVEASPSGRYVAIQIAWDGKDTSTFKIYDLENETYLEDETLENCRYSSLVWMPDESGLIYTKYIKTDDVVGTATFYHKMGTKQSTDKQTIPHPGLESSKARKANKSDQQAPLTEEEKLKRQMMISAHKIKGDGDYVYFYYDHRIGTNRRAGLSIARYDDPFNPRKIIDPLLAQVTPVAFIDGKLIAITDKDAPNGRLVLIDPDKPKTIDWSTLLPKPEHKDWQTLIPEGERVLVDAFKTHGKLYVRVREGMTQSLEIYKLDGTFLKKPDLPTPCDYTLSPVEKGSDKGHLLISNYLAATDQYEYDFTNDTYKLVRESECPHHLKDCQVTQGFATSHDGTKVPYAIIHRKDIPMDGSTPTVLYGYGGFNIPMTPSYSTMAMAWVRQGGAWVIGGIRGGSEYGYNWWKGGALENKTNCFEDFAAIARQLHNDKVTSPEKTIIRGGSNGGLLVGACINRFPGLFGGADCRVPVLDMLRYHLDFTKESIGKYWKSDFGDPDDPNQFDYIHSFSPVHNVRKGGVYPPTLISTADSDTRVEPLHAYKFAAALLEQAHPDSPIYLQVERHAGHGAGKSIQKIAAEMQDTFAFYERAVGRLPDPQALDNTLQAQRAERDARLKAKGTPRRKKRKPKNGKKPN